MWRELLKPFTLVNQFTDQNDHVIANEAKIDDVIFALTNIYDLNIEVEKLLRLSDLKRPFENVSNIINKNIVIQGDFNFYFDTNLESKGGKYISKKISPDKLK